jgi:hypothetical protein
LDAFWERDHGGRLSGGRDARAPRKAHDQLNDALRLSALRIQLADGYQIDTYLHSAGIVESEESNCRAAFWS